MFGCTVIYIFFCFLLLKAYTISLHIFMLDNDSQLHHPLLFKDHVYGLSICYKQGTRFNKKFFTKEYGASIQVILLFRRSTKVSSYTFLFGSEAGGSLCCQKATMVKIHGHLQQTVNSNTKQMALKERVNMNVVVFEFWYYFR